MSSPGVVGYPVGIWWIVAASAALFNFVTLLLVLKLELLNSAFMVMLLDREFTYSEIIKNKSVTYVQSPAYLYRVSSSCVPDSIASRPWRW